jgi:two-component system sensor histidine kinase/response regulator
MTSDNGVELDENPSFDPSEAMSVVAGDRQLLTDMVGLFCAESPRMLGAIRESVRDGDSKALARAAHALKGSVGNFGKSESHRMAAALEKKGVAEDMEGADAQFESLERMISRLERDLLAFCA